MQITGLFFILFIQVNKAMVSNSLRDRVIFKQKGICGLCTNKLDLLNPHEIHHLDHNASNHDINNLLALCCNCHQAHHRFKIHVYPYFENRTILNKNLKYIINPYEKFYD